ncbi:MAG: cytochrome c1, partial [Gammaproteobacteria bacterium]|nr:cytochrome c1 [Gammaproteobacteria bacterium]
MKKLLSIFFIAFPMLAVAAGGGVHLDQAPINLSDTASLKRGAKTFADYCLSCHAAEYMRYNRIGRDLGMTDVEVTEAFISTRDKKGERTKPGALMEVAMTTDYAQSAFGT